MLALLTGQYVFIPLSSFRIDPPRPIGLVAVRLRWGFAVAGALTLLGAKPFVHPYPQKLVTSGLYR